MAVHDTNLFNVEAAYAVDNILIHRKPGGRWSIRSVAAR